MSLEEMMAELQKEYLASFPNKISAIKAHAEENNMDELKNDFHKLKGTGLTYGIPEVSELALKMEDLCKDKHPQVLPQLLPIALNLLEKIYTSRTKGLAVDLSSQTEFEAIKQA